MKASIRRALDRGLSVLGEGSTLNGIACGPVNVQQVEVEVAGLRTTPDDNPVVTRDVARFSPDVNVQVGMILAHPDGRFRIDALQDRNRYQQYWLLMPADV